METKHITHFVFVDFENVPTVDLGVVEGKPVQVTLLIGKKQTKMDTAFSLQLHRYAEQVHPIEVGASGHNALDLTLAYHLGQAVQRNPGAQFCIASKDKDFDPLISHLKASGIRVSRHDSFATLPFLPRSKLVVAVQTAAQPKAVPAPAKKSPEERQSKVIARLKNPASRNRPSSRRALLAHIKTALGKEASDFDAEAIVHELCRNGDVIIDAKDKVRYPP